MYLLRLNFISHINIYNIFSKKELKMLEEKVCLECENIFQPLKNLKFIVHQNVEKNLDIKKN